jgi:hypothetical protein
MMQGDPTRHQGEDAISLTNLADRKRSRGQRRAGNAMLEPDPTYDADREGLPVELVNPSPLSRRTISSSSYFSAIVRILATKVSG